MQGSSSNAGCGGEGVAGYGAGGGGSVLSGDPSCGPTTAGGRGRAGGTIYIVSETLSVSGSLQALGGAAGSAVAEVTVGGSGPSGHTCNYTLTGGSGASGRIRLDTVKAFAGTSNPTAGFTMTPQ